MQTLILAFATIVALQAHAETGVVGHVNLSPAGKFEARTSTVNGKAQLNGSTVSAKNIKVPLETLKTGIDLRDKHMKEKYLEIAKFPEAELIEATGQNGTAKGKLKLHGVEKEIAGAYQIIDNKELRATFPLKLSDYNISGIRYLGVGVKDDVDVTVTLPLVAAPAAAAAAKK